MKTTMDMTTGLWETDIAPDNGFVSDDSSPFRKAHRLDPAPLAGLCEYVPVKSLYAGMPVEVATQDVERFISLMEDAVS